MHPCPVWLARNPRICALANIRPMAGCAGSGRNSPSHASDGAGSEPRRFCTPPAASGSKFVWRDCGFMCDNPQRQRGQDAACHSQQAPVRQTGPGIKSRGFIFPLPLCRWSAPDPGASACLTLRQQFSDAVRRRCLVRVRHLQMAGLDASAATLSRAHHGALKSAIRSKAENDHNARVVRASGDT